jgi:hypothetical protein
MDEMGPGAQGSPERYSQFRGEMDSDAAMAPPPPPAPPEAPEARPDVTGGGDGEATGVATKAQPLLIYTANYTLAVFETTRTIDAVQKIGEESGGYLVRRTDHSITVRVPAGKFRGALDAVTKLGDVLHRDESVEDVTERFRDLEIRLKNARAMRIRLEQLLVEAQNVKEALEVEREMARVTADIESMEGKLRLMRELIAFSTITVTLEPRSVENVNANVRLPFPWLEQLGLGNLMNL